MGVTGRQAAATTGAGHLASALAGGGAKPPGPTCPIRRPGPKVCWLPVYPPGVTTGAVVNGRTPSFGYTSLGK
jgi:hypothetical protein